MRLSNRNKAPLYSFINTLLIILFLGGVAGFFLERYRFHILGWESWLLILVPLAILVLYYLAGRQIFEYDSDGEALNFKNRNVVPFLGRIASDEFPKYKLLKYEVMRLLFVKRLYITVSSKKAKATLLKYDISYLSSKNINDLKISLNKVVKSNKENRADHNQRTT